MYKPEHYKLSELAHPQIIKSIGKKNTWRRLDADVLRDLDCIREEWYFIYKSGIYINRLNLGLDSRGLRPPTDPDGSFYSTHKQGNTFDLEPVNGKNKELYNLVSGLIKNDRLKAINTVENIEDTKNWVHIAKMNTSKKPLIINL